MGPESCFILCSSLIKGQCHGASRMTPVPLRLRAQSLRNFSRSKCLKLAQVAHTRGAYQTSVVVSEVQWHVWASPVRWFIWNPI